MNRLRDISGVWQGKYSYATTRPPNSFVLHLADHSGVLSGEVIEPNTITVAGPDELLAGVTGLRAAHEVSFTKVYSDIEQPGLVYDGTVNAALTRIDGKWHFPSEPWMHGRFMMVRDVARAERAKRARIRNFLNR